MYPIISTLYVGSSCGFENWFFETWKCSYISWLKTIGKRALQKSINRLSIPLCCKHTFVVKLFQYHKFGPLYLTVDPKREKYYLNCPCIDLYIVRFHVPIFSAAVNHKQPKEHSVKPLIWAVSQLSPWGSPLIQSCFLVVLKHCAEMISILVSKSSKSSRPVSWEQGVRNHSFENIPAQLKGKSYWHDHITSQISLRIKYINPFRGP